MSILKVEFSVPDLRKAVAAFTENRLKAFDSLVSDFREVVSTAVNQLLNAELDLFLGEPSQSDNKKNGFKERDYVLKSFGTIRVRLPQDRKGRFKSTLIPKHERIDPRLKEDIAALHLAGISTRTMALMSKRILGIDISNKSVSNALQVLSPQAEKWLRRTITQKYWVLIIDGTYFKVQRAGSVEREPSLVVIGIDENNHKSILAIEQGNRDNVDSWRALFRDLKERGLDYESVKLGLMDGLPGLERVFLEEFPKSVTARCWFHAMQNALAKSPKRLTEPFHLLARKVMYADGRQGALAAFAALKLAMGKDAKRAVDCLEKDLESLIAHYSFDSKMWRTLKTTNSIERINKELKRRTKSMETIGEGTLQTLVAFTALRIEMSWKSRASDTYTSDRIGRKLGKKDILAATLLDENLVH